MIHTSASICLDTLPDTTQRNCDANTLTNQCFVSTSEIITLTTMAEEEIGKINRKLQKMIDKSEVVSSRNFLFLLNSQRQKCRTKPLHEIC